MNPQPQSKLAYMVVGGQLILAMVCIGSLCMTLFYKNYSDPVVLTALIGFTGILIGNLGTILGGPMRQMLTGKTEIVNPPDKPVPVAPQPETETPKP